MRKVIKRKWLKRVLAVMIFFLIFVITFTLNQQYIKENTDMINVLVAVEKIPAYSLVTKDRVIMAKRPRSVVPPGAILTLQDLEKNKYYTLDLGFGKGDIIRTDRLSHENGSSLTNLAKLTEQNQMLVAVDTNLVKSCANLVQPGAVVDAIVFIEAQDLYEDDIIISPKEDPLLANLTVVDKKNSESAVPEEKGREAIPAVITLILDQNKLDVAKALVEYNERGNIYLLPVGFQGDAFLAGTAKYSNGEEE